MSVFIEGETATQAYGRLLGALTNRNRLVGSTRIVGPRGMQTAELREPCVVRINSPSKCVVWTPTRKLNYGFMAAEFLWIVGGHQNRDLLEPFMPSVVNFYDEGATFGAYGPRFVDQLDGAIEAINTDRDTRQSIICLWRWNPRDNVYGEKSRDIPCTLTFQFMVREGKLNMVTSMRSNDAWKGFPYDVFNFCMIQGIMAKAVGAEVGWYEHHVGSMHLYVEEWDRAHRESEGIHTAMLLKAMPDGYGVEVPPLAYDPDIGEMLPLYADLVSGRTPSSADDVLRNWPELPDSNSSWYRILTVLHLHAIGQRYGQLDALGGRPLPYMEDPS